MLDKATNILASAYTPEIKSPITSSVKAAGSGNAALVTVNNKSGVAETGQPQKSCEFFKPVPEMPYRSSWGMFGMNIKQDGIEILGDQLAFNKYMHFWRRALEVFHDAQCGPMKEDSQPETDEDHIVGRYVYIKTPVWGRCKVFYEASGEGKQQTVFFHTAGSDSRRYHGVMNHPTMRQNYIGAIAAMVKALKLNKPIICGATMAGQVCLAVTIRADEVGAGGTIPLQGSGFLNMERQFHDRSPNLIWHLYSAQAYGIFHGDLDFCFGGWDGRSGVGKIDTKKCPVFMFTGVKHKAMPQLAHFSAT
ncbi:hypothetical protein DL95DRAFT_428004 [Leptodontidium sp. 2 PMI_412]|nr:hypothetical protein DL95DRAFT_428004 [Leptodontidium sp. 2 PMI_412]